MSDAENSFKSALSKIQNPRVLEVGTYQWTGGVSTHHGAWLPDGSVHIKSDIFEGPDVDVKSDVHDLKEFEDSEFDAFIAASVWEHVRKPWLASAAVSRVIKPGGIIYIATHFAFPVHGYPSDYSRWTDKGLESLFDEPEWINQVSGFSYPCTIKPPKEVKAWNTSAPAYLNVNIFAQRSTI
jgi:SAM-dependent methyltransferase